jgi:DNA-binding NtrC family response regulator
LRALQEREFDRLGDTRAIRVDIRVIATTNRPLEAMIKAGSFRADLYYRLNVIPLSLPALRERPEDVAELAEYFTRRYAAAGTAPAITAEFLIRLQRHSWPGNVRELANLMRRAVALSAGEIGVEVLEPSELAASQSTAPAETAAPAGGELRPGLSLECMEKRLLEMTLDATGGNRSRAAEMLGVSLRTVRNKIREYGLPPRRNYAHI